MEAAFTLKCPLILLQLKQERGVYRHLVALGEIGVCVKKIEFSFRVSLKLTNDYFKIVELQSFLKVSSRSFSTTWLNHLPSGLTPCRCGLWVFLSETAWLADKFFAADKIKIQPFRTELGFQGIPLPHSGGIAEEGMDWSLPGRQLCICGCFLLTGQKTLGFLAGRGSHKTEVQGAGRAPSFQYF